MGHRHRPSGRCSVAGGRPSCRPGQGRGGLSDLATEYQETLNKAGLCSGGGHGPPEAPGRPGHGDRQSPTRAPSAPPAAARSSPARSRCSTGNHSSGACMFAGRAEPSRSTGPQDPLESPTRGWIPLAHRHGPPRTPPEATRRPRPGDRQGSPPRAPPVQLHHLHLHPCRGHLRRWRDLLRHRGDPGPGPVGSSPSNGLGREHVSPLAV